jgi:hypothetical protein
VVKIRCWLHWQRERALPARTADEIRCTSSLAVRPGRIHCDYPFVEFAVGAVIFFSMNRRCRAVCLG